MSLQRRLGKATSGLCVDNKMERPMCKAGFLSLTILLSMFLSATTLAKSQEEETPALVQSLAKQLVAKKRPKVAMLDFTNIQGHSNEYGRFMADQLSVDMVKAEGITVVDRANINAIMAEHQLTVEGLVKPENAKKLGEFAGVDAILIGNLAVMDNTVVLTVKGISTETAEVVAAERMKFDVTKDIQRMMGLPVNNGLGSTPKALGGNGVKVEEEASITTVEIGPLNAVLKSVTLGVVNGIPQTRLTFDMENRNLDKMVAVAANSIVYDDRNFPLQPQIAWVNGLLTDSNKIRWGTQQEGIRGVATVYCFETIKSNIGKPSNVRQNSPSNIVDYIKQCVKYDGTDLEDKTQRLWSGSFTSIEPGKKVEMTVVFSVSPSREERQEKFKWPESAELSLELVVATHKEGEAPEKANDLALRNLNISRLILPAPGAK
jgi:TolB-like protein